MTDIEQVARAIEAEGPVGCCNVPDDQANKMAQAAITAHKAWLESQGLVIQPEGHPHTWPFEILMAAADRMLAEHYPPDIFTGVSGDPGPNLVVALRECRQAMIQAAQEGE